MLSWYFKPNLLSRILIGLVLGANMRHAALVIVDRDRRLQGAHSQFAVTLRLLVVQIPGQATGCGSDYQRQGGQ